MSENQKEAVENLLVKIGSMIFAEKEVVATVDREDAVRKQNLSDRHRLHCRENIFLYFIALPIIFKEVKESFGLSDDETRQSLGGEYHRKYPEFLGHNPINKNGHPFSKQISSKKEIYRKWCEAPKPFKINESYPDLALKAPAPASIVVESKYFVGGNPEAALVDGIREVIHYRGLPATPEGGAMYDFGCLLAFDASSDQRLVAAWNKISNKKLFWESVNIFPLVIGNSA